MDARRNRCRRTVFLLAFGLLSGLVGVAAPAPSKEQKMEQNTSILRPLTAAERRIIRDRGTESPGSGSYLRLSDGGTYLCRQCAAPLYRSADKFDSRCGWPAFDDEIPGAVRRLSDPDGSRTEILCARCGGHLGHVFAGERLTPRNTRHCVNSLSLLFVPAATPLPTPAGIAIFAGGCFWGVEELLRTQPGVLETTVGYTGGKTERPTYQAVCSGKIGHAEALQILFDPAVTSYETLARLFFEIHDPTQVNRQGPDIGDQYRSEVFHTTPEQRTLAEALIAKLKARGYDVATRVTPASIFWPAEDYHQQYYLRKGSQPYCHRRIDRFGD